MTGNSGVRLAPHPASDVGSMDEVDELLKDFLIESHEKLDFLDRALPELEKHPNSQELLSGIFRAVHTLKGTAGFLSFQKLEAIAHSGEGLLSRIREGKLLVSAEIASGLLAMVDAARQILANLEATGHEGGSDDTSVIKRLDSLQRPSAVTSGRLLQTDSPPQAPRPLGQMLIQSGQVSEAEIQAALEAQRAGDPRRLGEILVERGAAPSEAIRATVERQKQMQNSWLAAHTIRVDVGKLDKLMDLVEELAAARNQITRLAAASPHAELLEAARRLSLITSQIECVVMKTRVQPVHTLWSNLPRVVRDLAMTAGKEVQAELGKSPIELDRALIEAIKDPIIHIVRNAIDHGIEFPAQRRAAGKPPEGHLGIRAFRAGDQVQIEISDDGAGIDLSRVKQRAVELGIITAERTAGLSEDEAIGLLFIPGFSTSTEVTPVSGRGVGLDVVQANIGKIGGTVEVETRRGRGTTLKIKIPSR